MISPFLEAAQSGRPVFVTDLRRAFSEQEGPWIEGLLVLPDGSSVKRFGVPLPTLASITDDELELVFGYVRAEVYNHLTTLGGFALTLYADTGKAAVQRLLERVVDEFQIDRSRSERSEYGRIVNVLDRINDALHPDLDPQERRFTITLRDIADLPEHTASLEYSAPPDDTLRAVTAGLDRAIVCGLDVGGTDIKAALCLDGHLVALKEFDWNPAAYPDVERIIDPILTIARLLRARAAIQIGGHSVPVASTIENALRPQATVEEMEGAAGQAEKELGTDLRPFDAIGLCFPDVVVRNLVVGGEVPKTQGMRRNEARDFEAQFAQLTSLHERLQSLCRRDGAVMITNDGPMAAFTAAVELSASPDPSLGAQGVFAHSLGTDLGTGLVLADGSIPEIPLEVYNLILDVGSDLVADFPPEDLRSLANTNTGISGTPQKLASQAGAFRLADAIFSERRPDLLDEIERRGYVVEEGPRLLRRVPEAPVDRRKPYLAHLMELAETVDEAAEIFRTIGEYMAVVYAETEHLLDTRLRQRFNFGRFVKAPRCYELMCEGASRREPVELVAADSEMAYTPLMRELDADPHYTVAQFGQAVGAIYFANLGLLRAGA